MIDGDIARADERVWQGPHDHEPTSQSEFIERLGATVPERVGMWENIDKSNPDGAHYSIMRRNQGVDGMTALRGMFPDAKADSMNLVLFSTSGVHGTYNTIEEAEATVNGTAAEANRCTQVTFLIVHPRLVALRYGVCDPANADDIDYLKRLRSSSHEQLVKIGMA